MEEESGGAAFLHVGSGGAFGCGQVRALRASDSGEDAWVCKHPECCKATFNLLYAIPSFTFHSMTMAPAAGPLVDTFKFIKRGAPASPAFPMRRTAFGELSHC